MNKFSGEVVLVTGGSGGIGLATARLLSKAGARIYLVARHAGRLETAARHVGGDVHTLAADLTNCRDVARLAETLERSEGRLDLLVNCAGQLEVGPAQSLGADAAERLLHINYLGAVRTIEACLPLLRAGQRRSIVNVSSIAGRLAPPFMAAYAGSKFAFTGYTLALRQELRQERFHVGLVFPGPVDTAMTEGLVGGEHYPLPLMVPVTRPDTVAKAVLELVRGRKAEITVPGRLGLVTRLLAAWPGLTDLLYRRLPRRRIRVATDEEIS